MSGSGAEERTEKATPKRLREAHRKGKLQRSQDLTAWLGVGAAAAVIPTVIGGATEAAVDQALSIGRIAMEPSPALAVQLLERALGSIMPTLSLLLGAVVVVAIGGAVLQGGVHLKTKLTRFDQFDPVAGLRRLFGLQALWQGAKVLLKTAVIGAVLLVVLQGIMPVLASSGGLTMAAVLDAAGSGVAALLAAAVVAGLAISVLDVLVVMRKNRQHTLMTKKELRDERKNSDGDPLIRSQRRSRQLSMSRNRMMAAVADADVVLVNPTEIAVALRYDVGRSAPRVVATGSGLVAARIREEAERHGVPIVRDIPLARHLRAACGIGDEIPVDSYPAVASVLAFVAVLRRRGASHGIHSPAPSLATAAPSEGR